MSTKVVRTRFFMKKGSGTFLFIGGFCGACTHVRRKTAKFHYIGVFFHGGVLYTRLSSTNRELYVEEDYYEYS